MSTSAPKFENDALASFASMAPTVIADGADAGETLAASWFSFPAATTTVTPARVSAATAELRAADLEPPMDMFITALPARPRAVAFCATGRES